MCATTKATESVLVQALYVGLVIPVHTSFARSSLNWDPDQCCVWHETLPGLLCN
jgi:hypothetical protein